MNPIKLIPKDIDELEKLAKIVGRGMFSGLNDWNQVATVIAMGLELGLPPMLALRNIKLTKHGISLSADLMVAVCLASDVCEYFDHVSSDKTQATFRTKRADREEETLTYTIEEAIDAGLYSEVQAKSKKGVEYKTTWQAHTKRMLQARCKAFLARLVYPDVTAGFYTPDEMAEVAAKRREQDAQRKEEQEQRKAAQAEELQSELDALLSEHERAWLMVVCHGLDLKRPNDRQAVIERLKACSHTDPETSLDLKNRAYLKGAALKWGAEACQRSCEGIDRRTAEGRAQAVDALRKAFHETSDQPEENRPGGEDSSTTAETPLPEQPGAEEPEGSTDFCPPKPNDWAKGKDPVHDTAISLLEQAMGKTGATWEDVCADCREIFDFPSPFFLRSERVQELTKLVDRAKTSDDGQADLNADVEHMGR